jgi:hypothetical protein
MELFCCGKTVANRGGAKFDKNDEATFTASTLTTPSYNWLAWPVALN